MPKNKKRITVTLTDSLYPYCTQIVIESVDYVEGFPIIDSGEEINSEQPTTGKPPPLKAEDQWRDQKVLQESIISVRDGVFDLLQSSEITPYVRKPNPYSGVGAAFGRSARKPQPEMRQKWGPLTDEGKTLQIKVKNDFRKIQPLLVDLAGSLVGQDAANALGSINRIEAAIEHRSLGRIESKDQQIRAANDLFDGLAAVLELVPDEVISEKVKLMSDQDRQKTGNQAQAGNITASDNATVIVAAGNITNSFNAISEKSPELVEALQAMVTAVQASGDLSAETKEELLGAFETLTAEAAKPSPIKSILPAITSIIVAGINNIPELMELWQRIEALLPAVFA